jgi:hypothetical protein
MAFILTGAADPSALRFPPVEVDLGPSGFRRLIETLEQHGAEGMALPAENVRSSLEGARRLGLDFEQAWSLAINRLQPSQLGGYVDPVLAETLAEDRVLLNEQRPIYRAAYEHREVTAEERDAVTAAADVRLDGHLDQAA